MKAVLLLSLLSITMAIDCLNLKGQPVDYWIIFKMPTIKGSFPDGDSYYYMDSENPNLQFGGSIQDKNSPFLATVAQYRGQPYQIYWNDQVFDGKVMFDHAHSKGLIAGSNDGTAVIINHSLPKFPGIDSNGNVIPAYPSNALVYGQHIFCTSTTLDQVEQVASQYIEAEVNVFHSIVPNGASYPTLRRLAQQKFTSDSLIITARRFLSDWDDLALSTFRSRGGQTFNLFRKLPNENIDFYASTIGPSIGTSLVAETWGNGSGGLEDPYCQTNGAKSNLQVTTPNASYSYTKDHSKYAISTTSSKPWVCLSDINRQVSQHKRGGTAICFSSRNVWNVFDSIMTSSQQC